MPDRRDVAHRHERGARDAMDALSRKTSAYDADGEVVWASAADFEVLTEYAASSHKSFKIESGTGIPGLFCCPKLSKVRENGAADSARTLESGQQISRR